MEIQCLSGSAVLNLSACSISSGSAKSYTLQMHTQQQMQHDVAATVMSRFAEQRCTCGTTAVLASVQVS
jgi:hypothetical protein